MRLLGAFDAEVRRKVEEFAISAKEENLGAKGIKLKELGWEMYYEQIEERQGCV